MKRRDESQPPTPWAWLASGLLCFTLSGCQTLSEWGASKEGSPCTESVAVSPPQTLMPIPSHSEVLQVFPGVCAVLPNADFTTLSGHGLDKDLVVRQAIVNETQWLYVLNPGWWPVRVTLRFQAKRTGAVSDPVKRTTVPVSRNREGCFVRLALDGWSVKVLKFSNVVIVEGATVTPAPVATTALDRQWNDLTHMLPYLATRRPNLVRNGDFAQVDSKGFPIGWKLYAWYTRDALCTAEVKPAGIGERFLNLTNLKGTGTIGIYSDKIPLAPGREYTLSTRMAADRAGLKARIALTGLRYIGLPVTLDTRWRDVTLVWPAAQTAALPEGAKVRVEIHNDSRGALLVDQVRLVDSTAFHYAESLAAEQALINATKFRDGGSLYEAFSALCDPRLKPLSDAWQRRRAGHEWVLLGPFDSAAGGLAGVYPVEMDFLSGMDLSRARYVGKDGRIVESIRDWTIRNVQSPDYIDLVGSIGPFEYSEAYAFTHLYSEANRRARFLIGSDDGVKVWLNDAEVLYKPGERAAKPAEFSAPVSLRRGWNRVLVKVENLQKDWGFFFTLADEGGKRITNAKYRVSP